MNLLHFGENPDVLMNSHDMDLGSGTGSLTAFLV